MGKYNEIYGTIKCPHCGKDIDIYEQVKWDRYIFDIGHYTVGSRLLVDPLILNDEDSKTYTYASYMRPHLVAKCDGCNKDILYKVIVDHDIIVGIESLDGREFDKMKEDIEFELFCAKEKVKYLTTLLDRI